MRATHLKKVETPDSFDPSATDASQIVKKLFYTAIHPYPLPTVANLDRYFVQFTVSAYSSARVLSPSRDESEYHKKAPDYNGSSQ
eukprot:19367-Hanusia_phi.AAC.1